MLGEAMPKGSGRWPHSVDPAQMGGYHGVGRRRSVVDERDARQTGDASERLDRLTREGYKAAVDQAFEAQKSGMRLSRRFFENWVETLDDQAELNRRTLGSLQQLVREQSELFRELSRESVDAYDGFLDSLDAYEKDVSNLDVRKDRAESSG
jgi:hypothetical protein